VPSKSRPDRSLLRPLGKEVTYGHQHVAASQDVTISSPLRLTGCHMFAIPQVPLSKTSGQLRAEWAENCRQVGLLFPARDSKGLDTRRQPVPEP